MRVALSFPGCHRRGGVERIMLECANYLQEQGHETHVFATDWDEAAIHDGIIQHQVKAFSRPALLRLISFTRACRRELRWTRPRPEVLGAFGVISPPGGVLWVQSVHAAWLEISSQQRDLKGRLKQKLNLTHPYILAMEHKYFAQRQYRKLIALTPQVQADLMRFYNVPAQDIVVIPNGFAPNEFNLTRREEIRATLRQQLGYKDADKVVVFVANELERKGFGPLLQAIIALQDEHIHLLAVGRLNPDAYAAEIARCGLSERVRFTGPSSDVATYYAAADVFALPTQYEAWGLVIVEAMACGLPVLTSQLAGAAVVVREGQTGELLDDPADVNEIARKLDGLLQGRHVPPQEIAASVADYAWPQILPRYEEVLASCARPTVSTIKHKGTQ